MKPTPTDWPRMSSAVVYQDAVAAIQWLCDAFGFEVRLKVEGDKGQIEHSELTYGEAGHAQSKIPEWRNHSEHHDFRR